MSRTQLAALVARIRALPAVDPDSEGDGWMPLTQETETTVFGAHTQDEDDTPAAAVGALNEVEANGGGSFSFQLAVCCARLGSPTGDRSVNSSKDEPEKTIASVFDIAGECRFGDVSVLANDADRSLRPCCTCV